MIYYVFTVIRVNVHNTVFYNPIRDRWLGYCIYEMYLFSRISKALFEQVFSGKDTDKDADIQEQEYTQTHQSKSYLIQKEQLQSMTLA